MIKISSTASIFLVNRLLGSRSVTEMPEDTVKAITIRVNESLVKEIEELTARTEGWSRNLVLDFVIRAGLDLVEHEVQQVERQNEEMAEQMQLFQARKKVGKK